MDCRKYNVSNNFQNGTLGVYRVKNWEIMVQWRELSQATKFEKIIQKQRELVGESKVNKLVGLCLAELGRQRKTRWKLLRWVGPSEEWKRNWDKVDGYMRKLGSTYLSQTVKGATGTQGINWAGGWTIKVVWRKPEAAEAFKKRLAGCRWEGMQDLEKGAAVLALVYEKRGKTLSFKFFKPGQGKQAVKRRARLFLLHCRKG